MNYMSSFILESKLGHDPETGARAFLETRLDEDAKVMATDDTLPVKTFVFAARVNWSLVIAYVLLFGAGPLGAMIGSVGYAWVGVAITFLALCCGLLLMRHTSRHLFVAGKLQRTIAGTR